MANEKTPMDFEATLKEEAERYNLEQSELQMAVRDKLTAQVAKKIAERIIAGEVAPPTVVAGVEPPKKRRLRYALGREKN